MDLTLEPWHYAMLALAGAASGWVNVIAGGGSLLTVPIMIFLGLPGPVANGTNRIAIIAQNIAAVGSFFREGFSDFRLSASLAAAAGGGAYFGAKVGVTLEGVWFNRALALIMIGVMVIMATGADKIEAGEGDGRPRNVALGHALMVGAGFWGGFIQVAVGFLLMPILYRVMGLDLVRVNMHKVFIALMFSCVALFVFASSVGVMWRAGLALALGNAIGGFFGARATIVKGAPFIKRVLFLVIGAMAVKLLFF